MTNEENQPVEYQPQKQPKHYFFSAADASGHRDMRTIPESDLERTLREHPEALQLEFVQLEPGWAEIRIRRRGDSEYKF